MQTPQLWHQQIAKPDIKQIIQDLLSQIQKDFGMFGEQLYFDIKAGQSYQSLYIQLEQFLSINYGQQTEKLYPVLYRIDILEKDIKKAINDESKSGFFGAIAELIILKELQKVIIRWHYKKSNNNADNE